MKSHTTRGCDLLERVPEQAGTTGACGAFDPMILACFAQKHRRGCPIGLRLTDHRHSFTVFLSSVKYFSRNDSSSVV